MGKQNSSLTRVQPVFKALYEMDGSGESWLRQILEMATQKSGPPPITMSADLGDLTAPQFEAPADPPASFLHWLIRHPKRLSSPRESEWKKWSQRTQAKRRALLAGDASVQFEAITELESRRRLPRRAWWRFEGVTRVDCALLTPSTVIFVEGKRTERGPSKRVVWYPYRNQVLRVLDCAAALAQQMARPHFFVVLIVERDLIEGEPERQVEIDTITSASTIEKSLPHLTVTERTELLSHYLGTTTWQDIVERFDLDRSCLIDEVDC